MWAILVIVFMGVLILGQGAAHSQTPLPPAESDTEAFIAANFQLQASYGRVLCVSQNGACPAEISVSVPCLTAACIPAEASYPIENSFETLQAAADAAQPGDLILILPGRYAGIEMESRGGEAGAYIHFLGWGEPGSIIIDAPADPSKAYLRHHFYFIDTRYIIVQNLTFTGAERSGLFFSGYFSATGRFSHHIIVLDVYSHNNGTWGMHTTATSYILIQDSIFTQSGEEHGLYLSGSGDHMVVRRSVFQNNNASGLQVNADPLTATAELFYWLENSTGDTCGLSEEDLWQAIKDCYDQQGLPDLGEFFEDGISTDLILEQNILTGNGSAGGAAINLASVRNSTLRNNLIYGNFAAGIACWDDGYAEYMGLPASEFGCMGVRIVNNTLVDETGGRGALILNNDARQMQIFNNIIVRDRADAYEIVNRSGADSESGWNYYFSRSDEESPLAPVEQNSITGFSVSTALAQFINPNFENWLVEAGAFPTLNPNRPDFHPRADSILLTAGNPAYAPTLDLLGASRQGTEIGAFGQP